MSETCFKCGNEYAHPCENCPLSPYSEGYNCSDCEFKEYSHCCIHSISNLCTSCYRILCNLYKEKTDEMLFKLGFKKHEIWVKNNLIIL